MNALRPRRWLFLALLAIGCSVAFAASYNRVPNSTFAAADATCGAETGMTCWITDCLTDACAAGGGTIQQMLIRNEGGTWVPSGMGATAAAAGTTSDTFTLDIGGDALVLSPQVGGLTVQRAAAGVVTVTAADDDATAALTMLPGGAAALTLGGASTTSITGTTDGTGDAEVVLPASSIGKGELGGFVQTTAIFCGDLANSTTNFMSPVSGYAQGNALADGLTANDLSYMLAGTGCDAEDDTTEATADEIMFTQTAAKAVGMYCRVTSSGSNGVIFHLRTAAGATTPDVTCTIATGATECTTYTPTTTDIAANAAVDVNNITTENLSAQDGWCLVTFILQ